MDYKKVFKTLNLLIPFCYIAVGIVFLTDLFERIGTGKRIVFGVIVIGYGIFRFYKSYVKMRRGA